MTRYVRVAVLLVLVFGFGVEQGHAQPGNTVTIGDTDVQLTLGATLQPRVSYGWTTEEGAGDMQRFGFGFRRARLRLDVGMSERWQGYVQMGGGSGTFGLIDARVSYRLAEHLAVRVGRFVSAQPRAVKLTSHSRIDAVDRAAIAERWPKQTIGSDGRDFGLDLHYSSDRGEAMLFVHNGDGSWDRLRGNYREDISSGAVTRGVDRQRVAVSVYGAMTPVSVPGLEVGGFVSFNGSENPNTAVGEGGRTYISYAGHLYWGARPGSQPVRLKADVLGITYESVDAAAGPLNQHTLGYAMLGAVRLHPSAEVFGRFEQFDDNVNASGRGDLFVTGGISFSPSALRGKPYRQERLTLAYSGLVPNDEDTLAQHLLVIQAQLVF